MTATTFEQIIAKHGPMIARHYGRTAPDFTTAEFIDTLAALGRLYSSGATSNLQDAGEYLTAAANYLVDAEYDPAAAGALIAAADQRLQYVNDLALA